MIEVVVEVLVDEVANVVVRVLVSRVLVLLVEVLVTVVGVLVVDDVPPCTVNDVVFSRDVVFDVDPVEFVVTLVVARRNGVAKNERPVKVATTMTARTT